MEAPTKKYFKIGEVAEILGVNASTLRFWEKNFPQIQPMKNKKGDRIYQLKDIEILKEIYYLTHNKGMRLANASKKISKNPDKTDDKLKLIQELRHFKEKLIQLKELVNPMIILLFQITLKQILQMLVIQFQMQMKLQIK